MRYLFKHIAIVLLALSSTFIAAQSPVDSLKTQIDRDLILMGEEIKLQLSILTGPDDLIVFPEQPAIGALEVIESYKLDTLIENDKLRLFKEYGLTQWDSGDYWIPRLEVLKNNRKLFTDSLLVSVREVAVDTTKQKMFPIKGDITIDDNRPIDYSWLWWLLLLIPIGIVVFTLSRKRDKKSYEETLQPYEWTKYRLKKLDESPALDAKDWRTYYTDLTYILRKYLDSKVYGQAMESTTGQLLVELERAMADKGMTVSDKTRERMAGVLRKGDLVKFAHQSGDAISAKEDRKITRELIDAIHQVLPPPTEEELMQDARYRRKQELKKRAITIAGYTAASLGVIVIGLGIWAYLKGLDNVKDEVLGNEMRELYESQWITSNYGIPELELTTPLVPRRSQDIPVPDMILKLAQTAQYFKTKEESDALHIEIATFTFKEQLPEDFNAQQLLEPIILKMEEEGASNIILLDSPIEVNGIKGIEFTGTLELDSTTYDVIIQLFTAGGGLQMLRVEHYQDDEEDKEREYGRLIQDRITQSLKLTQPQPKKEQ